MISYQRALQDFLREPLFRLLAINLVIGISVAVLLLGGLMALNPQHLRDLIFADRAPLMALLLLLFGFVVTFGSVAMGTAIMTIGRGEGGWKGPTTVVRWLERSETRRADGRHRCWVSLRLRTPRVTRRHFSIDN